MDLDAYFARIGYTGSREPTRATIDAIADAHVRSIPFENLDVLLGRPIELALPALEAKLVGARRGGYCFEHNSLMLEVLAQLGFTVRPLSARVRIGRAREYTPARTHLFVRVDELEGDSWLVDVGVGGSSLTSAIRLALDVEQPTPHEPRRIIRVGGLYYHQVRYGDEWTDVNEFTLEEMPPIDRIVANWYTSAHPESHFKSRLIVARAEREAGRLTLVNRELSVRTRAGVAKRLIETPDHLLEVLARDFGLVFPAGTTFPYAALDWSAP